MNASRFLTRASIAALLACGAWSPLLAQSSVEATPIRGLFLNEPSIRIITVAAEEDDREEDALNVEVKADGVKEEAKKNAKPKNDADTPDDKPQSKPSKKSVHAKPETGDADYPQIIIQQLENGRLDPATAEKLQRLMRERHLNTGGMFQIEAAVQPAFWLGVECRPIDPAMRKPLKLEGEVGIVVARVMEKSPAAQAGLQEGDILLGFGDRDLTSVEQLIEAVQKSGGKELSLKLRRDDKEQTLTLKAEVRANDEAKIDKAKRAIATVHDANKRAGDEAERTRKMYEDWAKQMQARGFQVQGIPGGDATFDIVRPAPGIVLPRVVAAKSKWPDQLSVTIERKGNDPAQVTVRHGDKELSTDENHLDKLPPEVRRFAEELLGRSPMSVNLQPNMGGLTGPVHFSATLTKPTEAGTSPEGLRKVVIGKHGEDEKASPSQMQAMQEQLQRMQKQLDQLQKRSQQDNSQD